MKKELNINDYTYPLPTEKIALYPLKERDHSRLLVYKKGAVSHEVFLSLAEHLPQNSQLFFNNTKVIQARMLFTKETGAEIEIFLLNPVEPSSLLLDVMQSNRSCVWKCTIGNLKRWKPDSVLKKDLDGSVIRASLVNKEEGIVRFEWTGPFTFASIIEKAGQTPLPPYLRRAPMADDKERYQTVYSHFEGAVAAPTAGLHFTERVLDSLDRKGIHKDFLTLHVSAGTFQPVKTENAVHHPMHEEQIIVSRDNIKNLLHHDRFIIPVGTTSMRTLESIYWYGVKLMKEPHTPFTITQRDAYMLDQSVPLEVSMEKVLNLMEAQERATLVGETSIYIMPGYKFRVAKGLVTNFHQPASTLILLVAAFIGEDWRKVYDAALRNGYRFLSYGDSSLLLP